MADLGKATFVLGFVIFIFGFAWWIADVLFLKSEQHNFLIANTIVCFGATIESIGNIILKYGK